MPDDLALDESDQFLADALGKMEKLRNKGFPVSLEDYCQQRPELLPELRSLWATVAFAEDFGSALDRRPQAQPSPASQTQSHEMSSLPRRMGDYTLIREIGRGGMGVVHLARQHSLNRTVAVKTLLGSDLASPVHLHRFLTEAQAAAALDHPHLLSVFEVGNVDGRPYFTMPYVEGSTLAQRIAQRPLTDQETAELLIPVCRAVGAAHRCGILHRDLKPSNILIDADGRPLVADFGLAKRLSEEDAVRQLTALTETGAVIGTPSYMSPEQASGTRGELGAAADIYSLGAILYACVTGRPPFQAATPLDTVLMILEQDPPPPRMLAPRMSLDLEMIILKAMQKPADLRYASADLLADDLERFLKHEPVAARSSHLGQVLSRAFRPTHHVAVLENWGLLWVWHAAVVLVICLFTDTLRAAGVATRAPYIALWTVGLGTWAAIFWNLRRRAGPVTFVERQIAHVWAASMACSTALFGVESLLQLPVLTLSPVLALLAGAVFVVKAGILSGEFYIPAAALFAMSIPMAVWPAWSLTIFGVSSGLAFLVPGIKYHLARRHSLQRANSAAGLSPQHVGDRPSHPS